MLRLAGEIADGILLAWLPARQLRASIAEIAKGAERAGRRLADIDIACYLHTYISTNRERALSALRRVLVGYSQANTYIQGFTHFGYGDVLEDIHSRLQAGDRTGAEAAIPESMVDELYLTGSPEDCQNQLNTFIEAGVQNLIVAAPPTSRLAAEDMYALIKTFSQ
jgi:alkanesulfonate monooxygenase SsuD/methylene tetrahydromethanopterin reductase-like flavin-dependent oxidoreductase (luciferase family)